MVMVEWVDSFQLESGWHWQSNIEDRQPARCMSVGWLIREDESQLMLAETISPHEDDRQVQGVVVIPTAAIVRREPLTSSCQVAE